MLRKFYSYKDGYLWTWLVVVECWAICGSGRENIRKTEPLTHTLSQHSLPNAELASDTQHDGLFTHGRDTLLQTEHNTVSRIEQPLIPSLDIIILAITLTPRTQMSSHDNYSAKLTMSRISWEEHKTAHFGFTCDTGWCSTNVISFHFSVTRACLQMNKLATLKCGKLFIIPVYYQSQSPYDENQSSSFSLYFTFILPFKIINVS